MGTNCAECGKAMTKPQYEKCYNCMRGMKAEKQYVEKPIGGKGSQAAIYEPGEVVAIASNGKKYRLILEEIV
jgi:hypothetical protein